MSSINNEIMIKKLTWKTIRHKVSQVNPEFANIIDQLDPPDDHLFFQAEYVYGTEILKEAILQLPLSSHGLIKLNDPAVPTKLKEHISYNCFSNPVTLILENTIELFLNVGDRIIPFGIAKPGSILGLWKTLDTGVSHCPDTSMWELTAGTRSLFMLAKISENNAHNRLRMKYQISQEKPKGMLEHWETFKGIYQATAQKKPWKANLLFLSKKWFEHQDDKAWASFYRYLLNLAWQNSGFWRNQYTWGLILTLIQKKKGIKPPAYIVDIVKHLLALSVGALPGFQAAIDNSLAPISTIQEAYLDTYRIKYQPVIMQPAYFNMHDQHSHPIYFSMQLNTAMELSLRSSERNSTLTELYEVYLLMNKYLLEISKGDLNIVSTPLYKLEHLVFDYFHIDTREYRGLKDVTDIFDSDAVFDLILKGKHLKFPLNSSFFRGCIRIAHR